MEKFPKGNEDGVTVPEELVSSMRYKERYLDSLSYEISILSSLIPELEDRETEQVQEAYLAFKSLSIEDAQDYREKGFTDVANLDDKEAMINDLKKNLEVLQEERSKELADTN